MISCVTRLPCFDKHEILIGCLYIRMLASMCRCGGYIFFHYPPARMEMARATIAASQACGRHSTYQPLYEARYSISGYMKLDILVVP